MRSRRIHLPDWFHFHFVPSSVLSVPMLIGGMVLYMVGLFQLEFGLIMLGLMVFVLPILVCHIFEYFRPGFDVVYIGFVFSYELNDEYLQFKVFRTIPVFRVPVEAIRRIEPRRTTDRGLQKLNSLSFLKGDIWFWPVPFHMLRHIFAGVGHERWNYALRTVTGWTIIIVSPHEFISEIGQRLHKPSNA